MDTIDRKVMQEVAEVVDWENALDHTIHTVTFTLNGAHGGVDVIVDSLDRDLDPVRDITVIK